MSTDTPHSHSAPESDENFSKPEEVERNWDIPTVANLSDIQLRAIERLVQDHTNIQTAPKKQIAGNPQNMGTSGNKWEPDTHKTRQNLHPVTT
jgi:hypothetical protein